MIGRLLPILDITAIDEAAWRDLADHAVEANPMFEVDCMVPAARCLPNGGEISLVVAEEGGKFFGCFPVIHGPGVDTMISALPGFRRSVLTTHVRRTRCDSTPLLREERAVETARCLLTVLRQRTLRGNAGILVLEAMRDEGPVGKAFVIASAELYLPMKSYRSYQRPIVLRRNASTYREIHGGETRRTLGKKRRRLGAELEGDVECIDRSADPKAIDELLALESAGYKGVNGVSMRSHPGESEWFHDMCARFRAKKRLRLYSLQIGDRIVAMQLLVLGGDGLFSLVATYDERVGKFSPGIQLYIEVMNRFYETTDAEWLDSCTFAGNQTFLWVYPDRRKVTTFLIPLGGKVDRFYVRLYMVALALFGVESEFRSNHRRLFVSLDWIVVKWRR